jgi:hypothetical protein
MNSPSLDVQIDVAQDVLGNEKPATNSQPLGIILDILFFAFICIDYRACQSK